MLTTKTVCRPGSFIEVVPAGLLATLRYNQNGLLESISFGYSDSARTADNRELEQLARFAPNTINLRGGTTWVQGVFYSPSSIKELGVLPDCLYDSVMESEDITFYAGNVKSLAANFIGSITCRNWLNVNNFNMLPGIVVPLVFDESSLKAVIASAGSTFEYPYVAGYMIFEGNGFRFDPVRLFQDKIKSVYKRLTPEGYLVADLKLTKGNKVTVHWSDVVRLDLQTDTAIVYANDGVVDILHTYKSGDRIRPHVPVDMTCPICKKVYNVPISGPVHCDDLNCISMLYPTIQHMLSVFKLPKMTEQRFIDISTKRQILGITDVLLLDEYKDIEINTTISSALYAITPTEICADETFFIKFADVCNNSVDTVMYYITNPIRIGTDLNLISLPAQRYVNWVQQDSVILQISNILNMVKIIPRTKKFDGAPIFRNVRITLTGLFKRGNYQTISSILESYSATVMPSLDDEDLPNFVIIGSLNTNIDGNVIQKARSLGLPMFSEDDFFAQYDIDSQLMAANLL